jgi:hypothetical protein
VPPQSTSVSPAATSNVPFVQWSPTIPDPVVAPVVDELLDADDVVVPVVGTTSPIQDAVAMQAPSAPQ